MKITTNFIKQTKRHLCASGSILLPLAQKWRLVTVALCALAASALPTIISSSAHATSLTISIPENPLTVNVSANSNGGFNTASGTFKVSGDAAWGYTLTVKSGNEDKSNNLTTADGKNNILQSITEKVITDASGNNFPNNSWGYMPSKLNSISNSQYLPGPTSEETTIDKTNTATDATGTTYDFTLAAKVDATQPAGLYSGSFTFTAIANYVNYNITYDCKSGNGCPSTQTGTSTEKNLTLNNTIPSREGYKFLGYCTTDAMNEKRCTEAEGTTYKPNTQYPLTNSENTAKLIAMWEPTTMQTFGDYCQAMDVRAENTLTLADTRDENTYRIRKFNDGKCWMVDNLRIGDSTLKNKDRKLNPEDTDLTNIGSYTLPVSSKTGFIRPEYKAENVYVIEADSGKEFRNYGGYYTYNAATAGTGANVTSDRANAPSSICAKGWRLPVGGPNGEFLALSVAIGGSISSDAKLVDADGPAFIHAGNFEYSALINTVTHGHYWSSTASSDSQAYYLRFWSKEVNLELPNYRHYGFSVRCISRNE